MDIRKKHGITIARKRKEISLLIDRRDYLSAEKLYKKFCREIDDNWWPEYGNYLSSEKRSHKKNDQKKNEELKRQYEIEHKKRIAVENLVNRKKNLKQEQEKRRQEVEEKKQATRERQRAAVWKELQSNFLNCSATNFLSQKKPIEDYNELKKAWLKHYFSQFSSRSLSEEQVVAIGDTSHTCLLRARAGSGKTTVIKNKVNFMVRHAGLNENDIMVLAFNKAAADKVKKELQTEFNLLTFQNSRTFHSLAYNIAPPTEELLFDRDSGSNAKQSQFIEALLRSELNPAIKKDIYAFFRYEMSEIESLGSLLRKEDYYSLRRNSAQDTLQGEAVKSLGEKWIADFLFEHGIRYVYERSWYRDKSGESGNYYPDFSLAVAGNRPDVVIEHWGIDESDPSKETPDHWSQSWYEYRQDMNIKRKYWQIWNETNPDRPVVFLETSIRDTRLGREHFEHILREKLASINVNVNPLPFQEVVDKVVRKKTAKFAKMCLQHINKAKQACLSPEELDQKIKTYSFSCHKERVFVQLANRMFYRYRDELQKQHKIDYDDLMKRAADAIHQARGNMTISLDRDTNISLNDLQWIMIDEYQDFSALFFNLVDAIRQYNPSVRLFCVGDNWQAINGFAGSNLKYFEQFSHYFSDANYLDLQNNYRSQANVVQQGNRFMKNYEGAPSIAKSSLAPKQIRRYLTNEVFIEQRKHIPSKENPDIRFLSFIRSRGENTSIDPGGVMARQFKLCYHLIRQHDLSKTTFMILSRSHYQAYGYEKMERVRQKLKTCFKDELHLFKNFDKQVQCMTAHSSKGAEADIVILINVKKKRFPIVHPDNQLYEIFGDTIADVLKAEERLFYVAITRAKESLYVLTEKGQESEFLERIMAPYGNVETLINSN